MNRRIITATQIYINTFRNFFLLDHSHTYIFSIQIKHLFFYFMYVVKFHQIFLQYDL